MDIQLKLDIMEALSQCQYKAWRLYKEIDSQDETSIIENDNSIRVNQRELSAKDKINIAAVVLDQLKKTNTDIDTVTVIYNKDIFENVYGCNTSIKISKLTNQVNKIISLRNEICFTDKPPSFYRNKYCPACKFKDACYSTLKEKDCISLLAGIPPKTIHQYHSKGIFSVLQLSHLFRNKRRFSKATSSYLWELKALAIREKKTYIFKVPEFKESNSCIYLDFEGTTDEACEYLLGGIIKQQNKPDEHFSFWSNNKYEEEKNFARLFKILVQHKDAIIFHYGMYEPHALKSAAKQWINISQRDQHDIEKRMVNLLGFLRTHVYPPTYSNGLKEVANYLGFEWTEIGANGLLSMEWRKNWRETGDDKWKEKLETYNQDDCKALAKVYDWLHLLSTNAIDKDKVQEVSKMKRDSPYKWQSNNMFGDDYQYINKAAYFEYQRSKIYWRDENNMLTYKKSSIHNGKGKPVWKPGRINEIVELPQLKKCPHCGNEKLYHLARERSYLQTDLKFTSRGIKQWTIEYHAGCGKCARCLMKYNDAVVKRLQVGDNLLAWAVNIYVNYHVSFALVSRMLLEQFCIWTNPTYFNDRIYEWWERFKPEVDYCWQILLNSPVIHIDETTVRLGRGSDRGYVWVFTTTHTVYYHLTINHEAAFLHEWLKDYKGIIVTDFYPGYDSLEVKRQKCLIHFIRDLNDDLLKNQFDEEYKFMVVAFGSLLKEIISTVDKYGLKTCHLKKHIKETDVFYNKFIDVDHKSELSLKYAKRFKRHWAEIWTFLNYDNVPWNNNNAEVAIKAFAQHRRGVNGQFNENGLKQYLSILTVSQTCRYRDISFLEFIREKKGIWEKVHHSALPGVLPFKQARLFVRKLKFKKKVHWMEWSASAKRPAYIPADPEVVYKDSGWKDWRDWIGV